MKRLMGAALAALAIGALATAPAADAAGKKLTIALIPGLTTDAFYITMHKGAQAAADALGDTLVFQGAPDFNPVTQVPVLDAVIARHPDAILIAPTDKVQLVAAAEERDRRRHQGDHRRYLHRHRQVSDRRRRRRLPAVLRGVRQHPRRPDRGPRARQVDRREGQGLCLQRQARRLDHGPARGRLQGGDEEPPGHRRCWRRSSTTTTPTRRRASCSRCWRATRTSPACSAPTCFPPSARPMA